MALSCKHEKLECVHMSAWPEKIRLQAWTARRLSLECRGYEDSVSQMQHLIQHTAPEPLSDNETEYDIQEAEDTMDSVPSPIHRQYSFWNSEYEARRQARKRYRSPPISPDPDESWRPLHSLQPSHYLLHHQQRHSRHSISTRCSASRVPDPLQPSFPLQIQHSTISKAKPTTLLRRPTTRSMKSSHLLSLHIRKGYVVVRSVTGRSYMATFKSYLEGKRGI